MFPIMKYKIAKWAEDNRRQRKMTQGDIGKAIGVSQPQARARLHATMEFSLDEIEILEKLFNENSPLRDEAKINQIERIEIEIGEIPIKGAVQAGSWIDRQDEVAFEMDEKVPALAGYPLDTQCAYVVIGTSLNRIASPGSVLVAVDIIKADIDIKDNDLVIIERSRYDGQQVETTAKRVRQTLTGFELWPESDDPKWQQATRLDNPPEHEEIRIVAKVMWIVSRP